MTEFSDFSASTGPPWSRSVGSITGFWPPDAAHLCLFGRRTKVNDVKKRQNKGIVEKQNSFLILIVLFFLFLEDKTVTENKKI